MSTRTSIVFMTAIMVVAATITITSALRIHPIVIAIFTILAVVLVMAPLTELFFLVRRIRRHKFGEVGVGLVLLFLFNAFLSVIAYFAVYPPDSFYEDEFRSVAGLEFPASGDIVFSDCDFPDLHGDYCSICLINVDPMEFAQLQEKCPHDTTAQMCYSDQWEKLEKHLGHKLQFSNERRHEDEDRFTLWGTLTDRNSVVVYRTSW